MPDRPTVVSTFSGAGGMDIGFQAAGFDIVWANDVDRAAVESYRDNLGDHVHLGDLLSQTLPEPGSARVVIGGPPCQGFSVSGRMDPDDPRSRHVWNFMDVVERVGPDAWVMENVKSLAVNAKFAAIREGLATRADDLGYRTRLMVLNAADFGVPQARERMFLVGVRGADPLDPITTSEGDPPTVRAALASLPPYGTPGNDTLCTAAIVPARSPILRPSPFNGSLLFNGSGRVLSLDAPAKTLPASMGGNATPIVDQEELETGAPGWIVEYHRRLLAGEPVEAEVPSRMRRLTVEEAAVLQSWPADYRFSGPTSARFRQIGNAVPPRLAEAVALSVLRALQ